MSIRRERDSRRQSKHDAASMKAHQETMGAFGRAAEANVRHTDGSLQAWRIPQMVREPNSRDSKVERQYHKGLITSQEMANEKIDNASWRYINNPEGVWHRAPQKGK